MAYGVDETAVAAFEAQLETKLPDDYREFLLDVNGGQTARSHCVFTMRMHKVREDQTVLNSLNSLDDPDDRFNLAIRWKRARKWLPSEVVPVGYDGFGGRIAV